MSPRLSHSLTSLACSLSWLAAACTGLPGPPGEEGEQGPPGPTIAIHCEVTGQANVPSDDSAITAVSFDPEEGGPGCDELLDDSEPTQLVAPRDGTYLVTATTVFGGASYGFSRFTGVRVDEDDVPAAAEAPMTNDVGIASVATAVALEKGSFVEIIASQDTGFTIAVLSKATMTYVAPFPDD